MKVAPAAFDGARTDSSDFSMMHYTSGTTGKPKGAVHSHYAAVQQFATGRWVLDLHDDDVYWCTADPGWVTGTSYGIFAPWSNGITQLVYQGGFGATAWYSIIEKYRVTVWYTAPTALRMLVKAGEEPVKKYDLSSLRHICSVGEPLNPEVVMWGMKAFRQPIHDNWWQTETGGMMVANYPLMPVRPGSMGRPIPGVKVCVVDENFNEMPPGKEGRLVVKRGWPGMFPRLLEQQRALRIEVQRGLVRDRRPCPPRRRWLFLVYRAGR
jgi:acetyl-CoA synthetase